METRGRGLVKETPQQDFMRKERRSSILGPSVTNKTGPYRGKRRGRREFGGRFKVSHWRDGFGVGSISGGLRMIQRGVGGKGTGRRQ